jgi:hypothetical protein
MRGRGAVQVERRARRSPAFATTDSLRLAVFLFHAAIVGYVVSGWTSDEAVALLAYVILLPLIVLQWLLNGGSSIVSNIESLIRRGRWRHREGGLEGSFFDTVLRSTGIRATKAQINTVVVSTMFLLWVVAFLRMVEIVGL